MTRLKAAGLYLRIAVVATADNCHGEENIWQLA